MLKIGYTKLLPYSFDVILSQYFDYEHIAHVHPQSLGEYRLVEVSENRIVYDQIWPADRKGNRKTSRVVQRFFPPNEIEFDFVEGLHRGVKVHTRLIAEGEATRVEETYSLPMPNWPWLAPLVRPFMMQSIERVWKEDIDVGVCYGGWPGTREPPSALPVSERPDPPLPGPHILGNANDFPPDSARTVVVEETEIVIFHQEGRYWAMENRCTHTGGPLSLGKMCGEAVICPWHGAQFDRTTGNVLCGPARRGLQTYAVLVEGEELVLTSPPEPTAAPCS